jgi:hypothetical protein
MQLQGLEFALREGMREYRNDSSCDSGTCQITGIILGVSIISGTGANISAAVVA